jgi:DnaJ-class molecular chaperone
MRGGGNYFKIGRGYSDLYIRVKILNDDVYEVDFPHLVVRVPITYATAVLGGKVNVPSPHGLVSMTIPPGTSHGTMLRANGKGLMTTPSSNAFGSLVAYIVIDIPRVSEGGEELVRSLEGDLFDHEKVRSFNLKISNK